MCIVSLTVSGTAHVMHKPISIVPPNNDSDHCVSFSTDLQEPLPTTVLHLCKTLGNCVCVCARVHACIRHFTVMSRNAVDIYL